MRSLAPVAVLVVLAALGLGAWMRSRPAATPRPPPSPVALLPVTAAPTPVPTGAPIARPPPVETPAPASPAAPSPAASAAPATPAPPAPTPEPTTPAQIADDFTRCLQDGIVAARENRPADAVPLLARAHRLIPQDLLALRALRAAEAALAAGQLPPEERDQLEKRRAAERDDLLARARAALSTDVDLAGHLFAQLRDRYPDDAEVAAARPALEAARSARAAKIVRDRQLVEWRGHVARGEAAFKEGRLADAKAAYQDALKALPEDPLAIQWIAALDARMAPRPPAKPPAKPGVAAPVPRASPAAKKPARRRTR